MLIRGWSNGRLAVNNFYPVGHSMELGQSANAICFGPFNLDLKAGELHKDGRKIRLQEQPFQILKMLLDRAGEVVSREEIRRKLWPNDTIVEFDHSISTAIGKLRQALGDSPEKPRYVETVARRHAPPVLRPESKRPPSLNHWPETWLARRSRTTASWGCWGVEGWGWSTGRKTSSWAAVWH